MAKKYNFQNIRALLIEGFSDEELRHLCFDVSAFRPVHDQLAKSTGKTEIVQRLLEYVEQKGLIETLLDYVKKGNPTRYSLYEPYEEVAATPAQNSPPIASPPLETPPAGPAINSGKIHLTAEVKTVLRAMFSGYDRIAIEAEFGRGLSGSRVFRVRPVMADGQAGLPEVVKIAPSALIRQERQAYERWVKGKLPFAARLEAAPPPSAAKWDGLRYTLAGGGTFETQSLSDYYHQASPADLRWLLEQRLFQILGQHWWLPVKRTAADFQMQADYDTLLPVNLIIRPTALPSTGPVHWLGPDELPTLDLAAGDTVHLRGFIVTEVDRAGQQVTLNLPPAPEGRPFVSYRLRLKDPPNLDDYQEEQVIDSLYGQVVATRHDLLVEQVKQALGGAVDLTAPALPLPDYIAAPLRRFAGTPPHSLPNPLLHYQDIPLAFRTVKISTIHHDLNMENVLLDPATKEITLIDFASVREGHALHDLLHLETAIVTKLVPPALAEAGLPPQAIWLLYAQLHGAGLQPGSLTQPEPFHPTLAKVWAMLLAIRSMAGHCLFNPKDWTEYYYGLMLYLLGALKFKDLDAVPGAKAVAFWGAGVTLALLNLSSSDPSYSTNEDITSLNPNKERKNKMAKQDRSQTGVTISNVTGNISGVIVGRDFKQITNISDPPQALTDRDKPTLVKLKPLLSEIRYELAAITANQEALKKLSDDNPSLADTAETILRNVAKKIEQATTIEPGEAEAIEKSLKKTSSILSSILAEAKPLAHKAGEVGQAAQPIAEKLEPVIEKLDLAAVWVVRLLKAW